MRHFRILLFTLSILINLNIDAKIVDRQPEGEIPFHLAEDNRIYVTAFVNGSDSLNFLVDTGASSLVLNTNSPRLQGHIHKGKAIDNLGASGESTVEYSHDNFVKIGTVQYEKAGCAHIPYPPEYWDGVVGLNALRAFNIEINYDDMTIYCYSKKEPLEVSSELIPFPFEYKYEVPFITMPVKISGTEYDLLLEVDTGSDRVIDLNTPFVNSHYLLNTKKHSPSHIFPAQMEEAENSEMSFSMRSLSGLIYYRKSPVRSPH